MPEAVELDARGRRLRAALAAVLVRDDAPELRLVHGWLDAWSLLGLIVAGMSHQGFTVSLGEHGAGRWTVTHEQVSVPFYMDGSVKAAVDLKP
jgi:hypothetical protein